jgi:hypothetical protein
MVWFLSSQAQGHPTLPLPCRFLGVHLSRSVFFGNRENIIGYLRGGSVFVYNVTGKEIRSAEYLAK